MLIKVLGVGCADCKKLYELTEQAIQELDVQAQLVKVEDLIEIVAYGVMRAPALVVNEKVKAVGKVPKIDKIKQFISEEL